MRSMGYNQPQKMANHTRFQQIEMDIFDSLSLTRVFLKLWPRG